MSQESGIYAIDVDVINKGAKSFYKKYGFEAFQDNDRSMVITMKTVQRLLKTY